jgi:sarcosine oxidase
MRVLIIGVGGVGAMAAWRLAQAGHEVVALEQFRLDHDKGSSYGDSRIVRRVYPDTLYTALMADAYPLWEELQALTPGEELFVRAGGIFCGPAEHPFVLAAQRALAVSRVEYEILSPARCSLRFPAFVLRPEEVAVYEPSMGFARASRCVRAAAQQAVRCGAQIRTDTPVAKIRPGVGNRGVRVTTQAGETHEAERLLLAAGAWTGPILQALGISVPLVVTRQPYVHLKPERNAFEVGRFPVWIDAAANSYTYGFPRLGDVPGVKIGIHDRGEITTPETVDRDVREEDREAARRYAASRFPWLSAEVVFEKVCLYTNTPDEDFILDTVPGLPDAVVISACSGHGFKFTPLLGQIAADLFTGTPVPYDLARFRLARFAVNA